MPRDQILFVSISLICALASRDGFAAGKPHFVNAIKVAGNLKDLHPGPDSAATNRLGAFGSDLFYDRKQDVYYGLVDRGPGGGNYSYDTRVEVFTLSVDPATGKIGDFKLQRTVPFKSGDGSIPFNGAEPNPPDKLKLNFDPEGFVLGLDGHYFVSEEYGPGVYEFQPFESGDSLEARMLRVFYTPKRLQPKLASGTPDYAEKMGSLTSGRQDNHGFEGLAITPSGTKLYAMLQGPLVEEGPQNDGRRGRNLRIVEFDVASGKSTAQFAYQLENIDDINARIQKQKEHFKDGKQGRSIGISALLALSEREFLVLERDNRGLGIDDPTQKRPVGTKRIYRISLDGASDVSNVSLAGDNLLSGVAPVKKELYFDVQASLQAAGQPVPEKIEGMTFGPILKDGSSTLILMTDNDFSVSQNEDSATQQTIFTNGRDALIRDLDDATAEQGKKVGAPPSGFNMIPTYIFSFRVAP